MSQVARVLYVNGTTRPGGAWESLKDIVFNLDRGAFEPAIACAKPPAWNGERSLAQTFAIKMPMWRKGKSLLRIPKAISQLRGVIREHQIAIVHANSVWDVPYSLWAARPFKKVPVVAHVRTQIDKQMVRKYSLANVDAAIATSQSSASVLSGFERLESKVHYLPNGVDLARFLSDTSPSEVRKGLGFPQDSIIFGAVGRIDKLKGLDLLVSAFSLVSEKEPRARLLFVGDSKGKGSSFKAELLEQVELLHLADKTVFAGHQDDILLHFAALDVLVMPSRTEGFGRSAVEAMAMGKPVVVSDVGALPEIVSDGESGYVVKDGDMDGLAARMVELASNERLRRSMGEAGQKRVRQRFDLKQTIKELQDIYKHLLDKDSE